MNDSNNARTMYETIPAAAEMNKVPGFDPLKFLRRAGNSMKLDLPYQKLWFRMAHPNGRMRVTAMRITDQMAIFEAKVFMDRSDAEPFSMSVVQQTKQNNKDYVKVAQNEALSQALSDAGFGIQLVSADVQVAGGLENEAAPAVKAGMPPVTPAVKTTTPEKAVRGAQKADGAPEGNCPPSSVVTPHEASEAVHAGVSPNAAVLGAGETAMKEQLPVETGREADVLPADIADRPADAGAAGEADQLPVSTPGTELPAQQAEAALSAAEETQELPKNGAVQEAAAYTKDTPVEEILKAMSLEQAQQVVVDSGVCRGMTIAEVAKKRPVNLRFYLTPGNKSKDNIVRAAAQLVLDSLQKAS